MIKKDPAASRSGSAWLWIAGGFAIVIAAGGYMMANRAAQPTSDELAALVPETAPVEETVLTEQEPAPVEDAGGSVEAEAPVAQSTSEEVEVAAPSDEGVVSAQSDDAPEAEADATPEIDEVRLAADGVAVVAGRAEPGATVEVIVDGDVVASAEADAGGSFAAIGIVEADDAARVLSLRSVQGDEAVVSTDEVIIAPIEQPTPEKELVESEADSGSEQIAEVESPPAQAGSEIVVTETPDDSGVSESESVAIAENSSAEEAPSKTIQEAEEQVQSSGPVAQADAPAAPDQSTPKAEEQQAPQIALLKSDEQGVTLLQTAPEPPARVQLDTIGYSDSGAVQLAGRAGAEAVEIRVYLNNRAAATLPVKPDRNWRGEVPDVDAGVYTLRVDAVDGQGAVTSRIETPFKREAPEVLAAASAQIDGPASAVTVQRGDTLWAIARDRYGEGLLYVQVFEANRASIRDPDLIYPGQIFELPPD